MVLGLGCTHWIPLHVASQSLGFVVATTKPTYCLAHRCRLNRWSVLVTSGCHVLLTPVSSHAPRIPASGLVHDSRACLRVRVHMSIAHTMDDLALCDRLTIRFEVSDVSDDLENQPKRTWFTFPHVV